MRIDVVTIFPELFDVPLRTSIIGRAVEAGVVEIGVHDLREHGLGRHRTVDDYPYGGGAGMVMRPEPLFAAIEPLRERRRAGRAPRPRRRTPDRCAGARAGTRAAPGAGVWPLRGDRRARPDHRRPRGQHRRLRPDRRRAAGAGAHRQHRAPAARRISQASHEGDSFASGLLEYPQYTRPETFRDLGVPPVLLSGHHGEVDRWRRHEALRRTRQRRPDLLDDGAADRRRSADPRRAALAGRLTRSPCPLVGGAAILRRSRPRQAVAFVCHVPMTAAGHARDNEVAPG